MALIQKTVNDLAWTSSLRREMTGGVVRRDRKPRKRARVERSILGIMKGEAVTEINDPSLIRGDRLEKESIDRSMRSNFI